VIEAGWVTPRRIAPASALTPSMNPSKSPATEATGWEAGTR
jgi:hypothetical protein